MKRTLPLLLLVVACGDDSTPPLDTGIDAPLDASRPDTGAVDAPTDATLDAGMDGAADASTDAFLPGDGMTCRVAGHYDSPIDVASRGNDRWLLALNRIVRTDETFSNPVEELETAAHDVIATTNEVMIVSSDQIYRRLPDGSWEDATPADLGDNPVLRGNTTPVLSDGEHLREWADGSWLSLPLPDGVSELGEAFTAYDGFVFAAAQNSIWTFDGTDWTETPLAPLSVVEGPPLPPVERIWATAPEPTDSGVVFAYVVERTSGRDERGVATAVDGTLTKHGDPGFTPVRVRPDSGGYVAISSRGMLARSTDGATWDEPIALSFSSPRVSLDDASVWATVNSVGVFELQSTWELTRGRWGPDALTHMPPDPSLPTARAYGSIYDATTGESRLAWWTGTDWSATLIPGPAGNHAIRWLDDTAYFLTGNPPESALLNEWTSLASATYPDRYRTNGFSVNRHAVYINNRTSILGYDVYRFTDSETRTMLPRVFCSPANLVAAGEFGLLAVGCRAEESGSNHAMWLDGDEWTLIADLTRVGQLDDRVVFWDEAAGTYPTYDGETWSSWTGETGSARSWYLQGDDSNYISHSPGELVWQVDEETRSVRDVRLDRVLSAVTHTDRIIVRVNNHTFDCVPDDA